MRQEFTLVYIIELKKYVMGIFFDNKIIDTIRLESHQVKSLKEKGLQFINDPKEIK